MSMQQRLNDDLKIALKAGDRPRVACLRMLKSKLQEKEVAFRSRRGPARPLTDEEVLEVIAAYAKQRRESIESYRRGSRDDLVAREEQELGIVNEYLPEQLSAERLREIVDRAVADCGAASMKDLGAVMKLVMPRVKGAADGKVVSQAVREALGRLEGADRAAQE